MHQQTITMTTRELSRYEVIKQLLTQQINGTEAAKQLGLSVRQVKNLRRRVKERGPRGIIHGNRGRPSNRSTASALVAKTQKVVGKLYRDFGPTFAAEKLEENHGVKMSSEKLRQLMAEWGYWKPMPRKKKVKELRLAGITTKSEANQFLETYLPKFNKQFGVTPATRGNAHRKLIAQEVQQLPHIFARHSTRQVANDFTLRFKNQWIQLEERQPVLVRRKERALMEEWLDDSLHILLRGKELRFRILPERPAKIRVPVPALTTARAPWKPPADHPWRKQFARQYKQKVASLTS